MTGAKQAAQARFAGKRGDAGLFAPLRIRNNFFDSLKRGTWRGGFSYTQ